MMASSSPARVDDSQRASSADAYHGLKNGNSRALLRPPEQSPGLKCPRCDSPNTKFCYYNNYSLRQPRYFCKTCRRYWTKGGALRNVPVGGGCRKNKRKSTTNKLPTSTSYSRSWLDNNVVGAAAAESGSLSCPQGLSISPVVDYSFSRIKHYSSAANSGNKLLSSYGSAGFTFPAAAAIHSESTAAGSLTGFNHPIPPVGMLGQNIVGASSSSPSHSTASLFNNDTFNSDGHAHLGSSIECLSSMNQDLHWKQHRLGLFFGGNIVDHKETTARFNAISAPLIESQQQQTIVSGSEVCVNGNGSSMDCADGVTIQPYFDSFCATYNNNDSHGKSTDNDTNGGNWNGVQAWNALHQLGVIP